MIVNELSTTIDLESTLIRAEALFRRFQRTVEAIDKKSNFPAPKLRQRPTASSVGSVQSLESSSSTPEAVGAAQGSTSGVDAVTAGSTNSGADKGKGKANPGNSDGKGKRKNSDVGTNAGAAAAAGAGEELQEQRPKVISPELRSLLSRKFELVPHSVVRKEGERAGGR
jgi:hypothetical protein